VNGRVKPIANWLCKVVEATTSASIRWIRLIICIRIIVSWVLVSLLLVITCWIDVCIFAFKIVCNGMIKCSSTLAYHFCFACVFVVVFFFCDNHQFIDVSRWEDSSWSSVWWKFRCLARLGSYPFLFFSFFRVVAHVLSCSLSIYFEYYFEYCLSFSLPCYWHRSVA